MFGSLPSPRISEAAEERGDGLLVSIVVPTRNRAHLLVPLLQALQAQTYRSIEIVVVDDASEDDTPEVLASWAGSTLRVLRLHSPSGSYAARNVGWRAARGVIVAFTDDDCLPQPRWVHALLHAMEGSETVGVQGMTLAQPGEITPFTHQIDQRTPGPPYRTCNIAYRRTVLERLGGFLELRWYADNILGIGACRLGSIAFAPDAVVWHPPRSREARSRADWRARFAADAIHRRELRRLGAESIATPHAVLPVVLWILRPLLKQSVSHVRYLLLHPRRYLQGIRPMAREKRDLLRALLDFWKRRQMNVWANLPERPCVTVVIVTRGRDALLGGALESIERQTWTEHEIVVIDHGSSKSTEALVLGRGGRYQAASGTTLGTARQCGVDLARGEIVAFIDDDCLADPTWLHMVVEAFGSQLSPLGVQGRTVAETGPIGFHAIRVDRPNRLYQTCNIAYRRDALVRVGGFDRRFAGWFEDTALAARVLSLGPIVWQPSAVVTHRAVPRNPLSRAQWRTLLADERQLARSYRRFYWRTRGPGWLATVIARWLLGSPLKALWRELPRAGSHPLAYLALVRRVTWERLALITGLFDVLRTRVNSPR